MMAISMPISDWVVARQAPNHRLHHSLIHCPRYFGLDEDIRGGLRQMARRFVEV
jgi:hypothetical protein